MFKPGVLRPSRVLGLLLFAVVGSFLGFVQWQRALMDNDPRLLAAPQWVFAMGAFTAMVGWLVNALVTVRNSVKQHTINTLLQPRLSEAYASRLKRVNDAFSPLGGPAKDIVAADLADPNMADALNAMRYFLNYSEFIALGIRHGDLDERLMCASLSGVIRTQYSVAKVLVDKAKLADKKNFEHLQWLTERWSQNEDAQGREDIVVIGAALVIALLAGWISNAALTYLTPPLRLPPSITQPATATTANPASAAVTSLPPASTASQQRPGASSKQGN